MRTICIVMAIIVLFIGLPVVLASIVLSAIATALAALRQLFVSIAEWLVYDR